MARLTDLIGQEVTDNLRKGARLIRLPAEIGEWQEGLWPGVTARANFLKALDEFKELCYSYGDNGNYDPAELADVMIALIGLAEVEGIDIWDAVLTKWEVVRNRPEAYWKENPPIGHEVEVKHAG